LTGTEDDPDGVVAELKTIPQILSTQMDGVPVWVVGSLLLVAQGMVIQSVAQVVPTFEPSAGEPPVTLKDMAGVLTENISIWLWWLRKII
jgi:hypothetical protein